MLKTLLAASSLSLALMVLPVSSIGPFSTSGAAGLTSAHAVDVDVDGGIVLGSYENNGSWVGVGLRDYDDYDDYDDGYYDYYDDYDYDYLDDYDDDDD
jgi:hypothetical protein